MKAIKLLTITIFSIILYTGCAPENADNKESNGAAAAAVEIPVRTVSLAMLPITRTLDYTSTLKPYEEVNLTPASPGRIEKLFVEPGDRVKKGDRLFLMDQTQLKQTEIQLKSMAVDLERMSTLLKTGSITQSTYDQLKTNYDVTKSSVNFMKDNTLINAPYNGIITAKYFEDGEMYSGAPNTSAGKAAVVTLMQIDPVKAIVNITEYYYPMIKKGMKATIGTDVYGDKVYDGSVMLIYPVIDPVSRTFQVEISVPNTGNELKPGMYANVAMTLGEDKAIIVPANTVLQQEGTNIRYIFLEENGVARRYNVTIGKRYDDKIEIISNKIKPGDKLIVDGQTKLADNDKVKVVN